MSIRLQGITNWPERAHTARYCVYALAKNCGVGVRTLSRHIRKLFSLGAHEWLARLRMRCALKWLRAAASVKETAAELGYPHAQHFSRDFKKHFGHAPSQRSL